ncbi:MAG: hypothetical protein AAGH41_00290 [Pseudomonadota bacterium]
MRTDHEKWDAAKKLHIALFTDLLKHGGFVEAFSTGTETLDYLSNGIIEQISEDLVRQDPAMTERLYREMIGE